MARLGHYLAALGLVIGLASLLVNFPLSVVNQVSQGNSIAYGVVRYFGFLTTIANIWLLLNYAAFLTRATTLRFFINPLVQTSALATIILVMLFQHFILNPTRDPLFGIDVLTDIANHYAAPLVYLAWWLATLPRHQMRWRQLPLIMLPAVLYPAYVLARGAIMQEYPYDVLDVSAHGYPFVLAYMGQVVIGFAVLCTAALAINTTAKSLTAKRNMT